MSDELGLQVTLIAEVTALLEPLSLAVDNPAARASLLQDLGWDLAAISGYSGAQLDAWLASVKTAVTGLEALVEDGGPQTLADLQPALEVTRAAVGIATGLPPALTGQLPPSLPVDVLVGDLLTYLVLTRLRRRSAAAYQVAVLLGIVVPAAETEPEDQIPSTGAPIRRAGQRDQLRLDVLGELLSDPGGYLRQLYFPEGWASADSADRATDRLFPRLAATLRAFGVPATYGNDPNALDDVGGALASAIAAHTLVVGTEVPSGAATVDLRVAVALSSLDRGGLGVVVVPSGGLSVTRSVPGWALRITAVGVGPGFAFGARGATIGGGTGAVRLELQAARTGSPDAPLRIGSVDGSRVEVGTIVLTATAAFGPDEDDVGVELAVQQGSLVISAGDGDGFLQRVLPEAIVVPVDIALGWSQRRGLYLERADSPPGAGIGGDLHVGLHLGPVNIPVVQLLLRPADGGLELIAGASADLALGPVGVSVERTGLTARLAFPPAGGNLGPLDVDLRFAPPAGIGVGIKSGLVTGAGYLFADPAGGVYAGALQLQVGAIGISAVGLLNTKLPGGKPGFSLVVIFSVRFPPIQLGLGFALTGIGGLVGIHRTVAAKEIAAGLRSGALDTLLFPSDLVTNARQIVSDLAKYVPPAPDQYVFGPAVELVWGTPPIVTITLGVFLELPDPLRIILAGSLRATLPTPNAPIVVIRLDMFGSLDLTAKTLAIDAVLRDSKVAAFTLTGEAAVRASWGETPSFLLAAGGFNPRFKPPTDFPRLARLGLALGGDNPRLRLSAYFALTSNTVQVGARLEVYASADIPVVGTFAISALLSFDALFVLRPFSFIVDITIGVSLTWNGDPFLAVRLDLTLSGPTPWHAVGTATFECFGTRRIHFDVTIGKKLPPAPRERIDVIGRVRDALEDPANWVAELPEGTRGLVTLRDRASEGATPIVHPFGTLTVRQKVAPLGVELQRYGPADVTGARSFAITSVRLGLQQLDRDDGMADAFDQFAPGQYLELSDAQKLAAPSYERMVAGVRVPRARPTTSGAVTIDARFETIVVDPGPVTARFAAPVVRAGVDDVSPARLMSQVGGAAATQQGPTMTSARYLGAPQVALTDPGYAVADDELVVGTGIGHLPTYAAAEEIRRTVGQLGGRLNIVESSEVVSGLSA